MSDYLLVIVQEIDALLRQEPGATLTIEYAEGYYIWTLTRRANPTDVGDIQTNTARWLYDALEAAAQAAAAMRDPEETQP